MSRLIGSYLRRSGLFVGAAAVVAIACHSLKNTSSTLTLENKSIDSNLEKGFVTPPDSIQTSVYWYWISDNISKEGVIKDLQSMKAIGINRAFIGNIGLGEPYGKVKLFTEEWWEILHAALKTATELNIEIGIFNSPGWSQSGGPWVKPSQAMRYLSSSSVQVKGGSRITAKLTKPHADFQDVRVVAFPLPKDYGKSIIALKPEITSSKLKGDLKSISDGDQSTGITFVPGQETYLDFIVSSDFLLRSIVINPARIKMTANVDVLVKEGVGYRKVKTFRIDRSNDALNVGFDPYAPVSISLPETKSTNFRLVFRNLSKDAGITDISLLSSPKVESYAEKTLAKMYPTPLPYWKEYQWPVQAELNDADVAINPEKVVDITRYLSADGTLNWDAPAGEWMVLRTGMVPTGVTNSPASPEGTGLEIDKMSSKHVVAHFEAFLGEIKKRIPEADRKTWKVVVQDSYETGGQNWTDELLESFKKQYGYDALPYLPVLQGDVVGSQEKSDRFLWDLRRFVADQVAYEYVGGLRKVSHKNGLTTWLENYGHWGFPGEFLQYGGQSDEVAGEFWSEGDLGDIENRAASSAAHIYGKNKVSAESFTAAGRPFGRYPALMKQRGDRFFAEGINNTLLHVFIHQAYEDKLPGVNAWFGNEFNRKNTWYYDMDLFVQYLKRCNFMLQKGRYVAQVAYFIGEDAPKMTGIVDPALPNGYSFDYINGEVIRERLSVKNGKLVLPDGLSYDLLVLPKLETIRPELLETIQRLVEGGAVVLGPKPLRSPSLKGFPESDIKVQKIADQLWGSIDGKQVKENKYGKGRVLYGMEMQEALNHISVRADLKVETDSIAFIHRTLPGAEVYFVSNQSCKPKSFTADFNVTGKVPEWWNAIDGTLRDLPEYANIGKGIAVPMVLAGYESAFIVFRKSAPAVLSGKKNFSEPIATAELTQPWKVTFDAAQRGPSQPVTFDKLVDWTTSTDPAIKYYSGSAVYQQSFTFGKVEKGQRVVLDLGKVVAIAKVKVNGVELGGVWTPPYQVDISRAIKSGTNSLEIKVVNSWANRLIGDAKLPAEQRKTWTLLKVIDEKSQLEPSGLYGPVRLRTFND
jgi:hypothetical protein